VRITILRRYVLCVRERRGSPHYEPRLANIHRGLGAPPDVSPRIAVSIQRERQRNAAPLPVWEPDWQDCPVAFKMRGLSRQVVSVEIPLVFLPGDMPILPPSSVQHWFIVHREDAAKVLLLLQQVQDQTQRYLETAYGRSRLQARYDWDSVVMDANARPMVRSDFELFFEREDWFRQHHLPYRRGYLLWGAPCNGKTATIRVMAAHPYIRPYTVDLSDSQEKGADVLRLFEKGAENTPALIILEDLDWARPRGSARRKGR
jgi:hypothetical protein